MSRKKQIEIISEVDLNTCFNINLLSVITFYRNNNNLHMNQIIAFYINVHYHFIKKLYKLNVQGLQNLLLSSGVIYNWKIRFYKCFYEHDLGLIGILDKTILGNYLVQCNTISEKHCTFSVNTLSCNYGAK
jgi:hypothetical protein